jgi:methylenetetrahydrofolate dehydrogenase (NADP+) / methenyltetrahydrofolate cyclohydrolase
VQLPLPQQVDTRRVLLAVAPHKDVDGSHSMNVGDLVAGRPGLRPCTPAASWNCCGNTAFPSLASAPWF